ncbi:TPA: hypothetical protein ACTZ5S_005611 [Bacillus cereus]|uniref:hypothetical protein n=1 Tax=Bacillus cereus TaxID=1396 RepID=UPI002AC1F43A|nr:hypothetical protein [Bacillus cereus]MDZ4464647.1 hypothetical protein [Bacillus cereus]MDZ4551212.1 hypothetical protein [Bacillus cereus]
MYWKIVEWDRKTLFGDLSGCKLIKEISPQPGTLFGNNLLIDGKTYRTCSGYDGVLAVKEMELNKNPMIDVISEDGLKCPYCDFVDDDAFELEAEKGNTECAYCHSEIKYVRNEVVNKLGECIKVIYRSEPVKLKEPIKL